MEGETPKMDEVKIEELKMEDVKIGEVKEDSTDTVVPPEPYTTPPARMRKLQFKNIPLDMKRMILSYVRREFLHTLLI